jgi:hypothetical protein
VLGTGKVAAGVIRSKYDQRRRLNEGVRATTLPRYINGPAPGTLVRLDYGRSRGRELNRSRDCRRRQRLTDCYFGVPIVNCNVNVEVIDIAFPLHQAEI